MSKPSQDLPAISRRPRRSQPAAIRIKGIQGDVVSFASPGPADQVWRKQLKASLGTVSDAFVDMALAHLEQAARLPGAGPSDVSINGALAVIAAFAPKSEVEAALALQAACVHMVAMVMVAVTLLFVLLRYTRLGVRIRAGTLDLETVAALGINVQMLRTLNFAVGIYLAGLSGVLAAGQLGLEPTMGTGLLMPSFIAIIVGGIGSLPGTLAGGLLIGVASGLTAVFLPAASEAVIYVLMAVILLIRPRGLFGEEGMMS